MVILPGRVTFTMTDTSCNTLGRLKAFQKETSGANNILSNRGFRLWPYLAVVAVVSFGIRVAALAHWGTGAIENEGAEYVRIAENLRNGVGFVGMVSPGPQLVFNPLFPWLIAGVSFITHNYEWAARVVSLFLGCLLPLPVFGIASRLFNQRTGFIAAILTIFQPLLVNLSFTGFSEGPYATLLLSAVYVVLRALESPSIKWWLLVGGAFGLAYLLRAEAVAAFLIALFFALAATGGAMSARCKRAAVAIVVFLALALPEVIFVYKSTGKVALSGKAPQFFAFDTRIMTADTNPAVFSAPSVPSAETWQYKWACYAIAPDLKGTGIAMCSDTEVIRNTRITLNGLFHLTKKGIRDNAPGFPKFLESTWVGAPLLPALALLGCFRRPWRGPQALSRLFFMLVAAAPVAATISTPWMQTRFYYVLIPFLLVWAANGLVEIGLWTRASSAAAGWPALAGPLVSEWVIPGLLGLAIVICPVHSVRGLWLMQEGAPSSQVEKDVGLWIGHLQNLQNRPVKIMDLTLRPTFYADGQWVHFPYCDGKTALRFLNASKIDYVILRRNETFTHYYADWLEHGIPSPRAELLKLPPDLDAKFIVYRWNRSDSSARTPLVVPVEAGS
jgi:hypothetical protein